MVLVGWQVQLGLYVQSTGRWVPTSRTGSRNPPSSDPRGNQTEESSAHLYAPDLLISGGETGEGKKLRRVRRNEEEKRVGVQLCMRKKEGKRQQEFHMHAGYHFPSLTKTYKYFSSVTLRLNS